MKIVQWIKREFFHVFPIFLFFLITFNLINITEEELFRKAGMSPFTFIDILVAAGLIAKILMVIDHLPWIDLFPHKPLLYNIAWKTSIYWVILFCVRFSIRLFPFLLQGESLKIEWENFITQMDWRLFASIQAWYLMLFFLFVTGRELAHAIGPAKMRRLFLGK